MVTTYSLKGYNQMIADKVRTDAYVAALRRVVRPGAVVLDLGAGTGVMALHACRFGASRVYAIDPTAAIQVARENADLNGYADRIEFIQELSTAVTLPERADVIVSDLRGVLPLFQRHVPSILDARKRLLAPDGVLIPQRDTLMIAVADAAEVYHKCCTSWADNCYDFDLRSAQRWLVNGWYKERVKPEQLLLEPQTLAILDYTTIEDPDINAEISWTVQRAGTAQGLVVWFDTVLAEGIGFSNAPWAPELIYGSAFFPWNEPIALMPGDTVAVTLRANLISDDYIWRWNTSVCAQGDLQRVKAAFQQSTFNGTPMTLARLRKTSDSYVPVLNAEGQIDQYILQLMAKEMPLGEIARCVSERFATQFSNWQDALTRVGALSEKYSQ